MPRKSPTPTDPDSTVFIRDRACVTTFVFEHEPRVIIDCKLGALGAHANAEAEHEEG